MAKKILILGATSQMAQSVARLYCQTGADFFIVARNAVKVKSIEDDLKVRGNSQVGSLACDFTATEKHSEVLNIAHKFLGQFDIVLIAYGSLGSESLAQTDYSKAKSILDDNFMSAVSLLIELGKIFEKQKHGTIAVLGSVAGDRGRKSNYTYGSAKAAIATYLQGYRARLRAFGVSVVTIKPGWVDTPMTANLKKGILCVSSDRAARGIRRAIEQKLNIAYVPFFWRGIMAIIKSIPEFMFKRMSI